MASSVLGKEYFVSQHASERWSERFGGDINESLFVAVPYGGQRGSDTLLRSGDAVFVVNKGGVVKTVLTVDQACVNMQSKGVRASLQPIAKPNLNRLVDEMASASDDELKAIGERDGIEHLAKYILSLRSSLRKTSDALVRVNRGEMDHKIRDALTKASNLIRD
jgi:hypothetical protein